MVEPYAALCPNCGSQDTLRTRGAQGLCPGCTQQRHQCRTCGQKFLSFWDMTGARAYGEPGQAERADDMPILDAEYSPAEVADASV